MADNQAALLCEALSLSHSQLCWEPKALRSIFGDMNLWFSFPLPFRTVVELLT